MKGTIFFPPCISKHGSVDYLRAQTCRKTHLFANFSESQENVHSPIDTTRQCIAAGKTMKHERSLFTISFDFSKHTFSNESLERSDPR